jgi:predicted oxidoreductase
MKTLKLGTSSLEAPVIAVGCFRMSRLNPAEAERFVAAALEEGACFFDHADVYGEGRCEEIFAQALHMNAGVREKVILQSKCGILPGRSGYDFSKEHILEAVDGSLKRLKTDYLDVLLLHRPDALVEPEEVAEAFDILESSGKVRYFGVSNHNSMQIQLLKRYLRQPLIANQLQLSIVNATMISAGINVNMGNESAVMRDGSVLDFCRLSDITVQAWSPFQYGLIEGVFLGSDRFPKLNAKIAELAQKYGAPDTAIVLAWIMRHPANIQPVTGTMNERRLRDCCRAADIRLSREEWYEVYRAAGNEIP